MSTNVFEWRFMRKVKIADSGCWEWQGSTTWGGYGVVGVLNTKWMVHRLTYTLAKGKIPWEKVLDHLCKNRLCCNPEHLEAVSSRENWLRSNAPTKAHAKKTHCPCGRDYDILYRTKARSGREIKCRACSYCRRVWRQKNLDRLDEHNIKRLVKRAEDTGVPYVPKSQRAMAALARYRAAMHSAP